MKKIITILLTMIILGAGIALFGLSHQIAGMRAFVVSSGSMQPALTTGSLIISKYIPPQMLKTGDIITFIAPTKEREFITHRVVKINTKSSPVTITTKGDRNKTADNWVLAGGGVVGKVVLSLPIFGYAISLTQTKIGIVLLILLPSIYIIYSELGHLHQILFRSSQTQSKVDVTTKVVLLTIFLLPIFPQSHALLTDTATLSSNQISSQILSVTPTPTPIPTLAQLCSSAINGNADKSHNTIRCIQNQTTLLSQINRSSVTNSTLITNTTTQESSSNEELTASVGNTTITNGNTIKISEK